MPAPLWEPPHLLCVCVCVCERERDRERQREKEREVQKKQNLCDSHPPLSSAQVSLTHRDVCLGGS